MKQLFTISLFVLLLFSSNIKAAQPYVGEIRMFAGNFAPAGWMFCEGQLLPISEYETLFQLIGTTYGGDGESTFALPDLRGRAPMHAGSNNGYTFQLAETGGQEEVTLTVNQIPSHTHGAGFQMGVSNKAGTVDTPSGNVPAVNGLRGFEYASSSNASMGGTAVISGATPTQTTLAGGSQPHNNMQPYVCINYIISLYGVFPSQY